MYNILSAMRNHRLFDRFGFNLPKDTACKESKIKKVYNYDSWFYDPFNAVCLVNSLVTLLQIIMQILKRKTSLLIT